MLGSAGTEMLGMDFPFRGYSTERMIMYMPACMSVYHVCLVLVGRVGHSIPLELELQTL